MKASLAIEAIGHDTVQQSKLWTAVFAEVGLRDLATVTFGSPDDVRRWGCWEVNDGKVRELHGKTDYSQANSKGSRGVRVHYILESGRRYLVRSPQSWKRTDTYVCHVDEEGEIIREKTIGN